MRLLADENVHAALVSWLRASGHDVVYAAEALSGQSDDAILEQARTDDRVIVTDDKDFGELVVHRRRAIPGVLLLRQADADIESRRQRLEAAWPDLEPVLRGHFVVVSDTRIRVRPIGSAAGS